VKKMVLAASVLTVAALVSVSGQAPQPAASTPLPKTDEFQPMVTKYCVGCHNTRNPLPAGAPLALDKVNLADPAADPVTWERVVKKLGASVFGACVAAAGAGNFRLIGRIEASRAGAGTPAGAASVSATQNPIAAPTPPAYAGPRAGQSAGPN